MEDLSSGYEAELAEEELGPAPGYARQADYLAEVAPIAEERQKRVSEALKNAFETVVEMRTTAFVNLRSLTATDLAETLFAYPDTLKPILIASNVAGRALRRDINLGVDTYSGRLTKYEAEAIAKYLVEENLLPGIMSLDTMECMDRQHFIDKEVRAFKGSWEKVVKTEIESKTGLQFGKVRVAIPGGGLTAQGRPRTFELDCANAKDGAVQYAIDVKRIEALQDIDKRVDEIISRARRLQAVNGSAGFAACIYHPFEPGQQTIRARISGEPVMSVAFAGFDPESIAQAVATICQDLNIRT